MVRVRVNKRDINLICVEVDGEWRIEEDVQKEVKGIQIEEWKRLVLEIRCKNRGEEDM